jgi:hypothetical protein
MHKQHNQPPVTRVEMKNNQILVTNRDWKRKDHGVVDSLLSLLDCRAWNALKGGRKIWFDIFKLVQLSYLDFSSIIRRVSSIWAQSLSVFFLLYPEFSVCADQRWNHTWVLGVKKIDCRQEFF